ncbi:hypothetical protein [Cupriavidus necator]
MTAQAAKEFKEATVEDTTKPVDRATLYDEVWTDPVTVVATRYGLSDVGLAKICRSLAIPLPSRGYWAKVKAGGVMRRVPLPDLKGPGAAVTGLVKLPPEQAAIRESARKTVARLRKEIPPMPPSEEAMASPHPLVRAASKRLHQRTGWPGNTLLRSAPKEVLNLSATKDTLDRALSIADALIKALAKQGFELEVDTERGVTQVKWLETGTTMDFSLAEYVRRSPHAITPAEERARKRYWERSRWDSSASSPHVPTHDFTPTGILTIQVGRWPSKSWKDTPKTKLEQRLSEVTVGILALAQQTHAKELEEARRKEAHQRAVARYELLTKRRADEAEKFKRLESQATNWERAVRLRNYADAAERQAIAAGGISAEQADWLAWTRAKADWLDPFVQVSDLILDGPEPKRPGFW